VFNGSPYRDVSSIGGRGILSCAASGEIATSANGITDTIGQSPQVESQSGPREYPLAGKSGNDPQLQTIIRQAPTLAAAQGARLIALNPFFRSCARCAPTNDVLGRLPCCPETGGRSSSNR